MVPLTAVIYYSSGTQSKISKGNGAWRGPQGIQAQASQGPQWILDSKVTWSKGLRSCHVILLLTFLFQTSYTILPGSKG